MNIAIKAQRKKHKKAHSAMLSIMLLFFFAAFLLLFLKDFALQSLLMAVLVPLSLYLMVKTLPRLFPMDHFLLSLIGFLCALGVLIQYRYSPTRGMTQAFNVGVGLLSMIGCALVVRHIKHWKLFMLPLMLFSCGMLALPFVFRSANAGKGATAWVGIGSFTMQPSELVKIALLFVLAYYLSRRKVISALLYTGVMLLFLVAQRDLGTAAIYGGTSLLMLYAATASALLIGGILGAGVSAVIMLYMLFKNSFFLTVQNRINNWLDPFSTYDQLGGGYQIVQALIAHANGGWWGTGLGLGNASVIPEFRTDFIFSALVNEFGMIFAVLVLCIYILIALRGVDIALRSSSAFHALLALGCAATFAVQTFLIIGGVMKFIPMTGVTVPFLSYGGTSLVSIMGIMGVLQGVASRNEKLLREDKKLAEGPGEEAL